MPRRDWIMLLILAAIWGSSYMFIELGLDDLSAPMVVFARISLGALVLVPYAHARGALRGLREFAAILVLIAAIQVVAPFLLIALGQTEISSALAGILVACAPIFTALLAIFFDAEERSEGVRGVGILVGIGGVVLLLGVDLGGSGSALLGGLAVVLASLGYAIGGLVIKRRLQGVPPIGIAAAVLGIGTVLSIPIALAAAPDEAPGIGALAAVFALGALGTGVAFAIFYGLISRVGPARAFVVTYLAPGFAVVYGAVLLDERVGVATVGGLLLILGGSWLAAEGRLPGRRRPPDSLPPPPAPAPVAPAGPATGERSHEGRPLTPRR